VFLLRRLTRRISYLIGGTAEIHFPLHISFELDALYRRNGASAIGDVYGRSAINDWQFPFLGKYEFKGGLIRPFVDAGLVYRHLSGSALFLNVFSYGSNTLVATSPNLAGFAAGGGVTLKVWKIRVSPEIRYTHWFDASGSSLIAATVNGNQADFLVGISY